jgi:hypothetical protein
MPKKSAFKRPFEIQYFYSLTQSRRPIAKGFAETLVGARGTVARHLARDDYYPKAAIIDRDAQRLVLTLSRTTGGITIKEH